MRRPSRHLGTASLAAVLVAILGLASGARGQAKAAGSHAVKVEVEVVPSR